MKKSLESDRWDGDFAAVRIGDTNSKGRGLFSTRALAAGDTALVERPLAGMQSLGNAQDVMVCRNCLGFIGDVILQLELLYGLPRHECLQRFEARLDSVVQPRDGAMFSRVVECPQGCGEVYCSEECRGEHFDRCHNLLCVGPIPVEEAPSHPLVGFRVHASHTNEIFLLVGEVVARIVSDLVLSGRDMNDAEAPFKDFVQEAWWDVAVARDDGLRSHKGATAASQKAEALPQTLRKLCTESASYLREALAVPDYLDDVLSTRRFGTVIGMFEQNNVGIRVPSPIPVALRALLSRVRESEVVLVEVAQLILSMEDNSEDSESVEGSEGCDEICGASDGVECGSDGGCDEICGAPNGVECGSDGGCDEICGASDGVECSSDGGCGKILGASNGVDHGFATGKGKCRRSHDAQNSDCAGDPEVDVDAADENDMGDDMCVEDARAVVESSLEDGFAPLDGTALYTLICAMNHSCRPNCVVTYNARSEYSTPGRADPLAARVVLLENVDEGVELTQSYINNEMCLEDRRQALEEYGFCCTCSRCLEESPKEDDTYNMTC